MTAEKPALTPPGYRPRLIESRLDQLLHSFGCVEIAGAKWCGKTWTALSRSTSVTKLDVKEEREAAQIDPSLALLGEFPHLVDEWQEVPEVWDAARRLVDEGGGRRGLLLLTGSCGLSRAERARVRHSGAGRIARLTMRPMSLAESGASTGKVSLASLFESKQLPPSRSDTSVQDVARWCCLGGWPANLALSDEDALEIPAQYLAAALDTNVVKEGRSPATAHALLQSLAFNASQAATYKTLARDAAAELGSAPSEDTVATYLELFDRLHLTEPLYGWEAPMRSKARVRVKPKRLFVDPSLAAALLGSTPAGLLHDMQTLGLLFENLVIRDLRSFVSTYPGLGNGVRYYRDDTGLEVDAVVERGGAWAGVEVKLSDAKANEGARNLVALRNKVLATPQANGKAPAFLAVVVGKGGLAYQRDDGVFVIPAAALTA